MLLSETRMDPVLTPGQKAPEFTLNDQAGQPVSLDQFAGRWLAVWWYPRACSEVCSIQGRAIVPLVGDLHAAGADIVGISFDDQDANIRFAEQENITFPLLSDTSMEIGEAYGVKRGPDEPFADAPRRITYLIDPEGRIAKTYQVDDADGHASVMLRDLRALAGDGAAR